MTARISIELSVAELEELMNHLLMWGWPKEEDE